VIAERALDHLALLYAGDEEYVAGVGGFMHQGLEDGEPVLVAVPEAQIALLRSALAGDADPVSFIDMGKLGRNPGRIIPAVRGWAEAQPEGRTRFVGQPIWPGRARSEAVEAIRHEALLNVAFADSPISILCPYDTAGLDDEVLSDAHRTHPCLMSNHGRLDSERYEDPLELWRSEAWALPDPPAGAETIELGRDLGPLRRIVARCSRQAGLDEERVADLVLAANEAATNSLVHTGEPGDLRIWSGDKRVVCEISDRGRFEDPLAGRRTPEPGWTSGRGMWLMNQLCDLVELRAGPAGTTVRLHIELAQPSAG
jgi:anti-sigma regulatory factor (Ser/Thr protein kinase)